MHRKLLLGKDIGLEVKANNIMEILGLVFDIAVVTLTIYIGIYLGNCIRTVTCHMVGVMIVGFVGFRCVMV